MALDEEQAFVDFYSILRVHPECDTRTLEAAYRQLAKMYHPDHPETADTEKFSEVVGAYRRLRNPDHRAAYDAQYMLHTGFTFLTPDTESDDERSAISDADAHTRTLMYLYKRRRENSQEPGVGHYMVQQMLNCSNESFEFHMWYLKEKGFIAITEQGTLAITITGVDHVIAMSRTNSHEKLRISQSDGSPDAAMP